MSAGPFATHQVDVSDTIFPTSVYAADVDHDGDLDVLSASFGDDKIAWYENTDGLGTFGTQQVVSTEADGARSVYAADMDGDGDADIVSASYLDDEIAWYENTDGLGTFGQQRVITAHADGAMSVSASDMDGDGDVDVLSASFLDDTISWYENTDGKGTFGPSMAITTRADGASFVHAVDLDGDGDMDVLSASLNDLTIAWFENTEGQGTFGPRKRISSPRLWSGTRYHAISVFATDIDADGDVDVTAAISACISATCGDSLVWVENTDGTANFGPQRNLPETLIFQVRTVHAADLDGDGDADVLYASKQVSNIGWHENTDGEFGAPRVITDTASSNFAVAADLNGDSYVDVLATSNNDKIVWYSNTDGGGNFGPPQPVTSNALDIGSIYTADLDRDGDVDVLSADDDKITWYETEGNGIRGTQQVISEEVDGANLAVAADVDGDGGMDVVSASTGDHKIAWYRNEGGNGIFGSQQIISAESGLAKALSAADIDGDGDVDVIFASSAYRDHKVVWLENTDGKGDFGLAQTITTEATGVRSLHVTDVDGDGDMDVLSASRFGPHEIAWYENTDGNGNFGPLRGITDLADGASSVDAADIDGDGDVDVLSASVVDNKIAWYENVGKGSFGPQKLISITPSGDLGASVRYSSIFAADVDGDGDMDVLSASNSGPVEVAWYENLDGMGDFGPQQVVSVVSSLDGTLPWGARAVRAADVDNDGDIDMISGGGDAIAWHEQLARDVPGDANGDFQFDQLDLVQVLQAAKFLTGEPASFQEGDWNGDNVFDPRDIVAVLAANTYEGNAWQALTWRDGLNLTFDDDGLSLRYRFYAPPNHETSDPPLPLILSLHNGSSSGNDNSRHVRQRMFRDLLKTTQTDEFASYFIAPQISRDEAFDGGWENAEILEAVLGLVDEVVATHNIDPHRVYVTGKSMGGWGTYAVLRERPELFAAAVPIASTVSQFEADTPAVAALIKDVPIWIFHGTSDSVMPIAEVRDLVNQLRAAGGLPRYTETDFGHNNWQGIFSDRGRIFTDSTSDELFEWLYGQTLPSTPATILGDATSDGTFDQLDILQVLHEAKYLTGEPASFEEGDWNRDGVFDQMDIVAALRAGNYVRDT